MLAASEQARLGFGEGGINGVHEVGDGAVAAFREVMVLDPPEDRLDLVELRAIRRQVIELDPLLLEGGQRFFDDVADVDRPVVHDHHQPPVPPGHVLEDGQEVLAGERPGDLVPDEQGLRPIPDEDGDGIDPPPLWVLVGQVLAGAAQGPTVVDRLRGAEAAFIQVAQGQLARLRPLLSSANSSLACATRTGSCL